MRLFEVDLVDKTNALLKAYKEVFSETFKTNPHISNDDEAAVRSLLKTIKIDKKDLKRLIRGYFGLKDDWIKKQGYPLTLLPKKYNAIACNNASILNLSKDLFVVARTESGAPVVSRDPNCMRGDESYITPQPWSESE